MARGNWVEEVYCLVDLEADFGGEVEEADFEGVGGGGGGESFLGCGCRWTIGWCCMLISGLVGVSGRLVGF